MLKIFKRINYALYRFQKVAVVSLFLVLLFLSAFQIILRLVFHTGIANAEGMMRYLVLWVAFLGASLAMYKNRHINLDVVSKALKKLNENLMKIIVSSVSFIILSLLLKAAVEFILNETSNSQAIFFVPIWMLETIIPLTFFFMALVSLQRVFDSIAAMLRAGKERKARAGEEK